MVGVCAAAAIHCGGSSGTLAPSPNDPAVQCPSNISVTSHSGQNPTVTFDTPAAIGGKAPVTVVCTPASGTQYKSGTTNVTCTATDAHSAKGSCNFSVIVTPIPLLLKTRFLMMGDSLTEGKNPRGGIIQIPTGIDPPIFNAAGSYPELLNTKLTSRYQDQTPIVMPFGRGGEEAVDGAVRLRDYWAQLSPDAVLIMEGTNDITDPSTATTAGMNAALDSVIAALRSDVLLAKSKGAFVFLATVPPLAPPVGPNAIAAVPTLNTRIRSLASEQNLPLVDIGGVIPSSFIGSDGIHPSSSSGAYSAMADEWLKAIVATMEAK